MTKKKTKILTSTYFLLRALSVFIPKPCELAYEHILLENLFKIYNDKYMTSTLF